MIPRIRGSAIQKDNGKWTFFLLVGQLGSEECDQYDFNFDFDTKDDAINELQKAAQLVCETFEKKVHGKPSGTFIDMKTNSTRKWDKSDEH